jgi:baseplate J-like protein
MTVALSTLLAPQTQQQLTNIALGIYQANGFPVQSWQPLGVERTRLAAFTTALVDIASNYIPTYTGAGFLDYATGQWLQLTAQELYNLLYNPAVFAQGSITLTAATGVGTQTLQAGQLTVNFANTGNRYQNAGVVVIPAGPGTVSATFQAANAGASFNDPSNQIAGAITLVTPIPGVSLTNPAATFSGVTHVGSGTGTITPSGAPSQPNSVSIAITSTGAVGVATFSYSINSAAAVAGGVTAASITNLGGAGINLGFANGASGTSFALGDSYSFTNPGSWITQVGANQETDAALAQRCRNRWASLSAVPTQGLYALLATSTPGVGAQVTQCQVIPDSVINNKVNIVVSGPGGVLPSTTITTIQNYITPRARGCDNPVVVSPTTTPITFGGTATVLAAQLATATNAITTALQNYIAGLGTNPTIRISTITELVMQIAGVVDFTGVTINGVAANLTLGGIGSYVLPAYPPTIGLSYVTQ